MLTQDLSDLKEVDTCVRNDIGLYFLDQVILYKRQHPKHAPLRDYEEVTVVPEGLRTAVIRAEHADSPEWPRCRGPHVVAHQEKILLEGDG